jgi:hypothetical protein
MKKKSLQTGFGGTYDKGENLVAAQWAMDSNVRQQFNSPPVLIAIERRFYL